MLPAGYSSDEDKSSRDMIAFLWLGALVGILFFGVTLSAWIGWVLL